MPKKGPRKGFRDLPGEIRNQIYGLCSPKLAVLSLINRDLAVLERVGTDVWYTVKSLPILHLDRRTRAEATAYLQEHCTFAVTLRPAEIRYNAFFGVLPRRPLSMEPPKFKPLPSIRNWLIDLAWDSQRFGNYQPSEFKKVLRDVVKEICHLGGTVSVTVNSDTRMPTREEGNKAVFDMLEPLADFRVPEVKFIPTVSVKTRFPPYHEYSCDKVECHRLTDAFKEVMMPGKATKGPYLHGFYKIGGRGRNTTTHFLEYVRAKLGFSLVEGRQQPDAREPEAQTSRG
ncbi:MAG: hypothetical protein Q9170_004070 [Blastenia crenularia]